MTTLEIIFLIIIWVIVGSFISYKRNWYKHLPSYDPTSPEFNIGMNIIFAPLALIMALFKEIILDDWNNEY